MSFTDPSKVSAQLLVRWGKLSEQNSLIYMSYKTPAESPDTRHQPFYTSYCKSLLPTDTLFPHCSLSISKVKISHSRASTCLNIVKAPNEFNVYNPRPRQIKKTYENWMVALEASPVTIWCTTGA